MRREKPVWLQLGLILAVLLLIGHGSGAATGIAFGPAYQWSGATPTAAAPLPTPEPSAGGFTGAAGPKSPPPANISAPEARDSDADQIPDAEDNCPLSSNPDQVDSNDNGLGDTCDAPFWEGSAFVTPTGVIQTRVDERGRPIQIVAPDALLTLSWSDDASRLEITSHTDGGSTTFALTIDLSDAALLEAFDAAEAETGRDLTTLRTWVGDHPGWVLAVARGEQPPPFPPTAVSSSAKRAPGLASMILPQPAATPTPTSTERYVAALGRDAANMTAAWRRHQQSPERLGLDPNRDLEWFRVERTLLQQATAMQDIFLLEMRDCLPCSAACRVVCNPKGSCIFEGRGENDCEWLFESECLIRGGVFFEGIECLGACWAFSSGTSGCFDVTKTDCLAIPERSRASGGQGNITTRFCPNQTCEDPPCPSPP